MIRKKITTLKDEKFIKMFNLKIIYVLYSSNNVLSFHNANNND